MSKPPARDLTETSLAEALAAIEKVGGFLRPKQICIVLRPEDLEKFRARR